jgi:hypothetical protein
VADSLIGSYNGVAYTVTVADDGTASGSSRVVAALQAAVGQRVPVTPTGPVYTVAAGDPTSAMAWLAANTRITETSGDVPRIVPPPIPGVVY